MRPALLLIIFSILSFTSLAQEYKKIFLGKDAIRYKGLLLKFDQNTYSETDYSFYDVIPTELLQTPVYNPTNLDKYSDYKTDTSTLVNRIFMVNSVVELNSDVFSSGKFAFELADIQNNEKIYYLYNSDFEHDFPFLVKGFSYSVDYVKKDLKRDVDEYTNEISITSPIESNTSISITKIISKNISHYYLNLSTVGHNLNYNGKGVMLLFNDGTKWFKPDVKIKVNVKSGKGWLYNAFIDLNQSDLNLFSNKKIKKFRLFIYDNYYLGDTEKFMYYMKSIRDMR